MNRDKYKTHNSVFTFGEIDDFCKEWEWIHVTDFIPYLPDHKPPYFICQEGIGKFKGIDGNEYQTWNTFRTTWIGDIKNDKQNKKEFESFLKLIAGDYYGRKREHYYFYDVLLIDGEPYNVWWPKEYHPDFIPKEEDMKYHGQPYYKVILYHMGVSNGKMWGRIDEL